MGNRAVITTPERKLALYLHWNGGRDSVRAFLAYCKAEGFRDPAEDDYGWACLAQVCRNFFSPDAGDNDLNGERGLYVGLSTYQDADRDNGDNGVYIIEGWKIVGRESFEGQEQKGHDLLGMLWNINETMPKGIQLNEHELEDAAEGADA